MSERAPPRPPGYRPSRGSGTREAVTQAVEPVGGESPSGSESDPSGGRDRPSGVDRTSETERPSDVVLPLVTARPLSAPRAAGPERELATAPAASAPEQDLETAPAASAPEQDLETAPAASAPEQASVTAAHEIEPGKVIDGRYQIEKLLGTGAVGLVYRCRHLVLDKPLAIKVLRPDFARDKEVSERLVVEAKAASSIGSPHIIETVDFGRLPDGSAFFVMEYLEGKSLGEIIEAGEGLGPDEVLHIGIQIAEALSGAHAAGIVHRDLKPDNVFITTRGDDSRFVKVLDFGIAKLARAERRLTRAGQVYGTPHYMSPEQAAGKGTDGRTDIYAVGVILFEMITGRVPFDADEPMGILVQHLNEPPPRLSEASPEGAPDIPGIDIVISKCLAKSPSVRYEDMPSLKADLLRLQEGLAPEAVAPPPSSLLPSSSSARSSTVARGVYALAVVGVVASALLAYALYLRGEEPVAAPSPPAESAAVAQVAAPEPAIESPPAKESPSDEEQGREVIVVVIPQDARITRGKEDLGAMPVTVRVEPGEKVHLGLRRKGFISRRLTLDGSRTKVVVGLVPRGDKPKASAAAEAEADEAAKEAIAEKDIEGAAATPEDDEKPAEPPVEEGASPPAQASGLPAADPPAGKDQPAPKPAIPEPPPASDPPESEAPAE